MPAVPKRLMELVKFLSALPEIGQAGKELIAPTNPYMRRESEHMVQTAPQVVSNSLQTLASPAAGLIPGVTIKELQAMLASERENIGGFGGPLAEIAGKTGKAAATFKGIKSVSKAVGQARKVHRAKKVAKGLLSPKARRYDEVLKIVMNAGEKPPLVN